MKIGPSISVTSASAPPWSPLRLFAAGEQGAWYDRHDLATMYQDSTGSTAVTGAGQTIGRAMDKSLGLAKGAQRITNGAFASGATGWTLDTGWSVSNGAIRCDGTNAAISVAFQAGAVTVGTTYAVEFDLTVTSGSLAIGVGSSGLSASLTTSGHKKLVIAAAGVGNFQLRAAIGFIGSVTNISVQSLAGNHAVQATTSARPLLQLGPSRAVYDGVNDKLTSTFPVSLGSSCTVARAIPGTGAAILTGQTVGTTFDDATDNCALVIVNRALTTAETARLTAYLAGQSLV